MRYVVLGILCAVAVILFAIARTTYRTDRRDLGIMSAADGVVVSIDAAEAMTVKYNVGPTGYEVVRTVAINHFPTIHAGDHVALVFDDPRPDAASLRHWSNDYQDAAVTGGFGLAVIVAGLGVFFMMGHTPKIRPQNYPLPVNVSLDHIIELRNTRSEIVSTLIVAAVTFLLAFLTYRYPEFFWKPWLAHVATAVILLLGIGFIWVALDEKVTRIRADQAGIEVSDGLGKRKFTWEEVEQLKHEVITQRVRSPNDVTEQISHTTEEVAHSLVLLGRGGSELFRLNQELPMQPLKDWLLLRAYIPLRTNLPVIVETKERLLDALD
jgi:hypothetical protein